MPCYHANTIPTFYRSVTFQAAPAPPSSPPSGGTVYLDCLGGGHILWDHGYCGGGYLHLPMRTPIPPSPPPPYYNTCLPYLPIPSAFALWWRLYGRPPTGWRACMPLLRLCRTPLFNMCSIPHLPPPVAGAGRMCFAHCPIIPQPDLPPVTCSLPCLHATLRPAGCPPQLVGCSYRTYSGWWHDLTSYLTVGLTLEPATP